MDERNEARVPDEAGAVAPTREDIELPERIVALPDMRTKAGAPVMVRVRRLYAFELALVRQREPMVDEEPQGVHAEAARAKRKSRTQRSAELQEFRTECEDVILVGSVEPIFYRGRKAPALESRPLNDEGTPVACAPLAALSDGDCTYLWSEIVNLSADLPALWRGERGKDGSEAARALADFRGEQPEGREDGARDHDSVRASDPSARGVGVHGEGSEPAGVPDDSPGVGA
jgi:hypothetical protein